MYVYYADDWWSEKILNTLMILYVLPVTTFLFKK